jgi:hypothetical protein
VIAPQQRPHSESGCSIISPQDRHRGGKTPSRTVRPIRRNRSVALPVKLAEACIRTHHQAARVFVNPLTNG